jgi:hypothetical protein
MFNPDFVKGFWRFETSYGNDLYFFVSCIGSILVLKALEFCAVIYLLLLIASDDYLLNAQLSRC